MSGNYKQISFDLDIPTVPKCSKPIKKKLNSNTSNTERVWDIDEIPYTFEEKKAVFGEIRKGITFGEIHKKVTKKELKSWFADITMKKSFYTDWCPNITGEDLLQLAKEYGLDVVEK